MLTILIFTATAQNIPAGDARHIQQTRSSNSVEFEVHQPTNPLPQALSIHLCTGTFGVTITAANGSSNTTRRMWNMSTCDFENGQANVSLNADDFPDPGSADGNYTVVFNISLQVDGLIDFCYLNLEVDNVTVSQGELIAPTNLINTSVKNIKIHGTATRYYYRRGDGENSSVYNPSYLSFRILQKVCR